MSDWSELKKVLNKKKMVARNDVIKDVRSKASYITIEGYLDLLELAGYLKISYKTQYYGLTPHYKVVRKIPEKLTIQDAIQIKKRPWLIWFKHFNEEK